MQDPWSITHRFRGNPIEYCSSKGTGVRAQSTQILDKMCPASCFPVITTPRNTTETAGMPWRSQCLPGVLTKNLSVELATENIRINAVAPGVVPTPLYGELSEAQLEALQGMQPLGRYGTPKDIADAVLYLANATWVTGVILPVDRGTERRAYPGRDRCSDKGAGQIPGDNLRRN